MDTSSIIHGWVEVYPPDSFPTFWERMEERIGDGTLMSPEDVREELKHPEDLLKWAKRNDQMFKELAVEVQGNLKEVLAYLRERLKREGMLFEPTAGHVQKV